MERHHIPSSRKVQCLARSRPFKNILRGIILPSRSVQEMLIRKRKKKKNMEK